MIRKPWVLLRPFIATCILLTLALLPSSVEGTEQSVGPIQQSTGTIIAKNDESDLVFDLLTSAAIVNDEGIVTIPGLDVSLTEAGAPDLPYFTTYIAIPPQATFSIDVEPFEALHHPIDFVRPVATYSLESRQVFSGLDSDDADESVYEPAPVFSPNPLIYERDKYYPGRDYSVSDEIFTGGLRLVRLDLFPLRYNAVRDILQQTTRLKVRVHFEGADLIDTVLEQEISNGDQLWNKLAINDPPSNWRTQTSKQETADALTLPTGVDTFKIELNDDGLFAISGADLELAGMVIDTVDPNRLQMMHRGKAVSHQFVDIDGTSGFDLNDEIRFLGWEFDGTRYEDMYVNNNVFWLWAEGNGEQIQTAENEAGKGYAKVSSFAETITEWSHANFFTGWQVNWDASPNEPTPWHWKRIAQVPGELGNIDLPIALPNPVASAGNMATITVEMTSRYKSTKSSYTTFAAAVSLNHNEDSTEANWINAANLNIVHQVPISQLLLPEAENYPENLVNYELLANSSDSYTFAYITRVTAEYPRELVAVDDQLIFGHEQKGNHEFHVEGFSPGASDDVIVWDISDKYMPVHIAVGANQKYAVDESTAVVVGRSHNADARFIATTTANIQEPTSITKYVPSPSSLTPPGNAGTWVAISHKSLMPAAEQFAKYRSNKSGISTWVVDIEEIANQVGYGFNTPDAIRDYLRNALLDWAEPPEYLTLFGDATINPRLLDCEVGCAREWDPDKPTLVPTDLLFVDRFNGLIPVDYSFSLLVGDDLFPDLAVGRVTAETLVEANSILDKIQIYENTLLSSETWRNNTLFVADNSDGAGNFCVESKQTATHVPLRKNFLCLPDVIEGTPEQAEETIKLRDQLFDQINNVGMAILNYRGHGSISNWAGYPYIMAVDNVPGWQNVGRPLILLSADCLDGNFASPSFEGLGEAIIKLDNNRGSAAHWASTGLGYSAEHNVLHNAFYDGVYEKRLARIGDVVNYAKIVYLTNLYDVSEAYAFTFLGDPAMETSQLRSTISLPVVLGQ